MEKKWWHKSVVYQIYPRSFQDSDGDGVGDIPGITERLPYLKELGVDVIWLSPVYESPNDDNGYDISNYRAVMKEFGTMEDFDRMLEKAHSLGLRIVMDLVVNHTSDEHAWFVESRKSKDNPYRDYYIWRDPKDGKEPSNWGSCFGGSAWQFDEATGQYYLHLFSKKQPDLNWDNPKVRDEVFDMMDWWLAKGIDGFRMDVISLISKDQDFPDGKAESTGFTDFNIAANGAHVHEYLQEMNRRVLSKYDLVTVGECSGVTLEEAKKYGNLEGTELSMCFQFEHMAVDSDPVTGKWTTKKLDLVKLKEVLSRWENGLEGIAWNSLFWDNHDQPRIVSRWGNDLEEYREQSAKMLATCLHMMKGTPYIYQGEELGMTNYPWKDVSEFNDIDSVGNYEEIVRKGIMTPEDAFAALKAKSRDNARTPMQWSREKNAGFTAGTPWLPVNPNYERINAEDALARPDSVFHYYQKLIALRKELDIIVYGGYQLLLPEDPDLWVYTRTLGTEKLLVVCNFSDRAVHFDIPEEFAGAECIISNYERTGQEDIVPYGAFVLKA
ncbi:MAG: alpha-glucosidase [Clostridium sp.]|nr:alpha-glucosidase [Clostridium sp.]